MVTKVVKKKSFSPGFKTAKPVTVMSEDLVEFGELNPGQEMPLLITPKKPHVDLIQWTVNNKALMEEKLRKHKAILFRGFNLKTDEDFVRYMQSMPYQLLEYFEGSTPRQEVGPKIYTSTLFPSNETIALHNEYSSSTKFPMKVWFFCAGEPLPGEGQTPIGSSVKILERLSPEARDKFRKLGWGLTRNFGHGLGLPWQRAFNIQTKERLTEYCKENLIELEWTEDDNPKTRQIRSAILKHPETGEEVWFNHMSFWHVANLRDGVREEMLAQMSRDEMPYHTTYGDFSPIPDDLANEIRDAYLAEKILFDWKLGDLMIIDNMLSVHGREPFSQEGRKIRVAMGEPYYREPFNL